MKIYAIDYGTSNSLISGCDEKKLHAPLEIDAKSSDPSVLRSVMFYPDNEAVFFGGDAVEKYTEHNYEGRLFRSIKKYLPNPAFVATQIGNKPYQLEHIISTFLREMKNRADAINKKEIDSVVLGRPARFSLDDEKDKLGQDRLEKAAQMAGFKNIAFFPEPLAAAYEYRESIKEEKLLLVVDLGGGTSDFTVMKVTPNKYAPEDVLSLGGLSVAGDAMDGAIMTEELAPHFGSDVQYRPALSNNVLKMPSHIRHKLASAPDIALMTKEDIMSFIKEVGKTTLKEEDSVKIQRLVTLAEDNLGFQIYETIENTKRLLGKKSTMFNFPYPDIDLECEIEKFRYQEAISGKVDEIFKTLDETMKSAGVSYDDIDIVCATGGTSKVPMIQQRLFERISKDKVEEFKNFHSIIQGLNRHAQELL